MDSGQPPTDSGRSLDELVGPVTLVAHGELALEDPRRHGISGITWDARERVLWGISDFTPRLVRLRPSSDWGTWSLEDGLAITGAGAWDGEDVVLEPDGFHLSNESGSRVLRVDARGQVTGAVTLPAHFAHTRNNKSLEALGRSPDGRYLFTANEGALPEDGPLASASAGARLRIVRVDLASGRFEERAYRSDPIPAPGGGDLGVCALAALSEDSLLVLERAWVPGVGNFARVYRVRFGAAGDVTGTSGLTDESPFLAKTLLVDLADLPDAGFPEPPEQQPNRIAANYEAMALGPETGDGGRIIFLASDDNESPTQLARVLVLRANAR